MEVTKYRQRNGEQVGLGLNMEIAFHRDHHSDRQDILLSLVAPLPVQKQSRQVVSAVEFGAL